MDNCSHIYKTLYLGPYAAAKLATKDDFDVIVSMLSPFEYNWMKVNPPHEIEWHRFIAEDEADADLSQYFETVHAILKQAIHVGKKVLVHCAAGVSRSPTLVIAYCMMEEGWTLKTAMEFVSKQRLIITPNDGFMIQLEELEKRLTNK